MKKFITKMLVALLVLASCSTNYAKAEHVSYKSEIIQQTTDSTAVNEEQDVSWPNGPKASSLSSSSAIVMDADTGLILYSKNMNKVHYPASITKILTTLLCIENCSLSETVTFKEEEVLGLESGASNIGTSVGETLTIEQCLYAIMLSSANEVCLGVADHVAGSISNFSDLMNERAAELGCKNTHFSNPNGLHSDDHYTSAYDMALISREAMNNDTFRKVTGTKVAYIPKTNKYADARTLPNHHNMLHAYTTSRYVYEDCIGGKTGYTSIAQNTLVTFAERDGMTLICVVMHGGSSAQNRYYNIYTDTTSLLDFAFENYQVHDLTVSTTDTNEIESPLFTKFNSMFDSETSPLQMSHNGKITLPVGVDVSAAKQEVVFHNNTKKAEEKNAIGTVTYSYGNKTVGSTCFYFNPTENTSSLISNEDIEFTKSTSIIGESKHATTIFLRVVIVLGIVLSLLFIVFYIKVIQRRRSISRRRYSRRIREDKKKDLHF